MRKKIKPELNKKELDIYYELKKYIDKNGYSPSYRDLLRTNIYKSIGSIQETIIKLLELRFIDAKISINGNILGRTIKIIDSEENNIRLNKIKEQLYEYR